MAALRAKRGLEAVFLARRVTTGSALLSADSLRSAASATRRTFLHQQRKHLSGTATTFEYKPLFQYDATTRDDPTEYRKLSSEGVSVVKGPEGKEFLKVEPEALRLLCSTAMVDIAHLLRPKHLGQLAKILEDPEASENDRFVALELLKNANIAAGMVLPGCQDTGTAIIMGKRGQHVLTDGKDEEHLSRGVYDTYTNTSLRYSQVAPMDMFAEKNTGTNLPAQIDLFATPGNEYTFQFMAKGGGSANKTFLFQRTKALLNEKALEKFFWDEIKTLGTAACPPYHLAIVIGGLSAELTLKTVKMASAKYLDGLPTTGDASGRAFRDVEWEAKVLKICQEMGIGAQFGGKYFCHDVRVIRTPEGLASGSFGPTTAGRMDGYVDSFMRNGGSFVTLAKGNRSKQVTKACKEHGGFYLGSIGGPAAILAQNCIKKVEVLEYPELGMEAVWKIEVENFPAFIVVDGKGNDFFKKWQV
eukprot:g15982.t1